MESIMFNKQHYKKLSQFFKEQIELYPSNKDYLLIDAIVTELAYMLKDDNLAFSEDRWIKAIFGE